jgi:hypothetical protein
MTQNFFISFLFIVIFVMIADHSSASGNHELSSVVNHYNISAMTTPDEPVHTDRSQPMIPSAKPIVPNEHKSDSPKMEELAHIHHFHKERVKKIKRHHKKFWLVSKLFIIVCHILLLICAYMHVTH